MNSEMCLGIFYFFPTSLRKDLLRKQNSPQSQNWLVHDRQCFPLQCLPIVPLSDIVQYTIVEIYTFISLPIHYCVYLQLNLIQNAKDNSGLYFAHQRFVEMCFGAFNVTKLIFSEPFKQLGKQDLQAMPDILSECRVPSKKALVSEIV